MSASWPTRSVPAAGAKALGGLTRFPEKAVPFDTDGWGINTARIGGRVYALCHAADIGLITRDYRCLYIILAYHVKVVVFFRCAGCGVGKP